MSKPGAIEDLLLQVKSNVSKNTHMHVIQIFLPTKNAIPLQINKRRRKIRSPQKTSRTEKSSISNIEEPDVSSVISSSRQIVEDQFPYDTSKLQREVDTEILIEKEQTIQELRETVDVSIFFLSLSLSHRSARCKRVFTDTFALMQILDQKIKKLEQLLRLKDSKIDALQLKLRQRV